MRACAGLARLALAMAMLAACCPYRVNAQDSRKVTEPHIPAICRSLGGELAAGNGTIDEGDEQRLDTERIQKAIDGCQQGTAVELRSAGANNAFLSGPLELKTGITLLVEAGTILFASRNPRDYDAGAGKCGTVDHNGKGCRPLIHVAGAQDAGVMGEGVIDGRGGEKLIGQNVSWWDLAQHAKVENASQNVPRLIVAEQADGFSLYRISLRNSPNFHVLVSRTNGFTAWGVTIDSPKTARNTDGIDPSSSTNVSILHCFIHAGDDNVAIKAGDAGPATHITIAHNHFYTGHGMSIGSETQGGVSAVEVRDLTIDGADNGIRIKSNPRRGGLVHDVSYRDICMREVKNPIVMETTYEGTTTGTLIPRFENILLEDVRVLGAGRVSLEGFDAAHPLVMTFDGVNLEGVRADQIRAAHARISTGPGQVNFLISGDDVAMIRGAGDHKVPSCDARFLRFPKAGIQNEATRSANHTSSADAVTPGSRVFVVASEGSRGFRSVQAAVDALPEGGGTITIRPGTYREAVHISKPFVYLEGDPSDPSKVVIVFDESAGSRTRMKPPATNLVPSSLVPMAGTRSEYGSERSQSSEVVGKFRSRFDPFS